MCLHLNCYQVAIMENQDSFKPMKPLDEMTYEELKSLYIHKRCYLLVMTQSDPCYNPAALKELLGAIDSEIFKREQEIYQDQDEGASGSGVPNTDKEEASEVGRGTKRPTDEELRPEAKRPKKDGEPDSSS